MAGPFRSIEDGAGDAEGGEDAGDDGNAVPHGPAFQRSQSRFGAVLSCTVVDLHIMMIGRQVVMAVGVVVRLRPALGAVQDCESPDEERKNGCQCWLVA